MSVPRLTLCPGVQSSIHRVFCGAGRPIGRELKPRVARVAVCGRVSVCVQPDETLQPACSEMSQTAPGCSFHAQRCSSTTQASFIAEKHLFLLCCFWSALCSFTVCSFLCLCVCVFICFWVVVLLCFVFYERKWHMNMR